MKFWRDKTTRDWFVSITRQGKKYYFRYNQYTETFEEIKYKDYETFEYYYTGRHTQDPELIEGLKKHKQERAIKARHNYNSAKRWGW